MHNYTRVAGGHDVLDVKSVIDLVLVNKDMLLYVQDVKVVKGMRRTLSDQHVVLCKVRLVGARIKRTDSE